MNDNEKRYKESEYDWTYPLTLNIKDTFKEEYLKEDDDIDDIYIDQSYIYKKYNHVSFSSKFTPFGIKILESWMSNEIRAEKSKYSYEELKKMIRINPHIHNIIKTNLLRNLELSSGKDINF